MACSSKMQRERENVMLLLSGCSSVCGRAIDRQIWAGRFRWSATQTRSPSLFSAYVALREIVLAVAVLAKKTREEKNERRKHGLTPRGREKKENPRRSSEKYISKSSLDEHQNTIVSFLCSSSTSSSHHPLSFRHPARLLHWTSVFLLPTRICSLSLSSIHWLVESLRLHPSLSLSLSLSLFITHSCDTLFLSWWPLLTTATYVWCSHQLWLSRLVCTIAIKTVN